MTVHGLDVDVQTRASISIGEYLMSHRLALTLSLILVTGLAYSAEPPATAPPATATQPAGAQGIQGVLLKADTGQYVIRDSFGKEVQLKVTSDTKIEGEPKIGDPVEVKVKEGGTAALIKKR
jgi:hypothetical protein